VASESDPIGKGLTPQMVERMLGFGQPPVTTGVGALMQGADKGYTFNGLPYRGEPHLFFKKDDPAWRQPQLKHEVHVRVFCTDVPTDMTEYTAIMQRVADSQVLISFEERQYDPTRRSWVILLRWMDMYFKGPEQTPVHEAEVEAPHG
jgi:hypothetical protein